MKKLIFSTNDSLSPTIVRTVLGLVLSAHGAQKLFGWFGGYGFEGSMKFFTGTVGLPWILGFLIIMLEFFGALLLVAGLATRFLSISIFFLMLGISITTLGANGFFMNWFGNQKGEGIEYCILAMGLAASLAITGGGRYSIDALIASSKSTFRGNDLSKPAMA